MEAFLSTVEQSIADPGLKAWAGQYARDHAARVADDVNIALSTKPKSILNIGGAPYLFEFVARQRAPDVTITSIDLEPDRLQGLVQALAVDVVKGDIERENPLPGRTFDAVVFNEVIEHCRIDLIGTVRRVASLAKPDGHIFVGTPNGRSVLSLLRIATGRTGPSLVDEWRKLNDLGHMGHVREYSARELAELFDHCDLDISDVIFRRHQAHRRRASASRLVRQGLERVMPQFRHSLMFVLRPRKSGCP
jgi:SAM-dependent methyltransferase